MIFFKRSSNSPRYFVPATSEPISNAIRRLFLSESGTSLVTIRCAKPSAIAVFPTPGSPIKTGLFFVRRDKICTTRRTSPERPTIGSILLSLANCVKSRAKPSNVGVPCGCWRSCCFICLRTSVTPNLRRIALRISCKLASKASKIRDDKILSSCKSAKRICSVPTRGWANARDSSPACRKISAAFGE